MRGRAGQIIPLTLKEGARFVTDKHRHHAPPQGHKWTSGYVRGGHVVGVACVGRPVARRIDQFTIVEVTRLATDGTADACSALYGASARQAAEHGYFAIITYTLKSEPGTSLLAAGWWPEDATTTEGDNWHREKRARGVVKGDGLGPKTRWVRFLREWNDLIDSRI